ncbi:MAG: hypothetical protein KGL39_39395, partial [Patescibacteria group bacterium]|nr:hypothetical protein [Patescibacteria group bacterium]
FIEASAVNVLSFEEVKIRYAGQGLVLIKGRNEDWPKRSNGAGKTNLLSLLPVALFGQTLKGQKNDAWASERSNERSVVNLVFKNGGGIRESVSRGRRPHSINLVREGRDASVGLSGKGKQETQGQIEEETGFDLKLLLNSVYIDQTIANGFVFGTQKDRMDLLGKLLDLDRFDVALKAVNADMKEAETARADLAHELESSQDEVSRLRGELKEAQDEIESDWAAHYKQKTRELKDLLEHHRLHLLEEKKVAEWQSEADSWAAEKRQLEEKIASIQEEMNGLEAIIRRQEKLVAKGRCGTCGQKVSENLQVSIEKRRVRLKELLKQRVALDEEWARGNVKQGKYEVKISEWRRDLQKFEEKISFARKYKLDAEAGMKQEAQRNARKEEKISSLKLQLQKAKKRIDKTSTKIRDLDIDIEMFEYSKKTLSRSGMPLYLADALCPLLNRASSEFSDIFTEGKIQIVFAIDDGEFVCRIINQAGSANESGQSVGEGAMAGIVAAFSLRESAPRTNLLILDEPGHGLDAEGAKQFARGLVKLSKMWSKTTILVTTHNQTVDSILEGEARVWTVVKKNGISRLEV